MDRFDWSESGFHQQLDFALVAEASEGAANASRIFAGEKQSAGFSDASVLGAVEKTLDGFKQAHAGV